MNSEEKLKQYIKDSNINCEYLKFEQSCHSVEEAALAANTSPTNFVKNICMIDDKGNIIIVIVKGEDRASTSRVAKALNIERPRIATPEEILEKTNYPCGGVPSFGINTQYLIDTRVMEKELIYSSGGSQTSLITITPQELQKANHGTIVRVRK